MKNKKEIKKQNNPLKKANVNKPVVKDAFSIGSRHYFALSLILILSFFVYLPVFQNGFVWDDVPYVLNNPAISSFNINSFFTRYEMGNYHPFTTLFYSIEYHLFGLNEDGFHAINILLHLIIIVLVFYAIFLLSNNPQIALIVALLFGIHPMHVESVAWISELKDLLYTLFFLGSYILYLKYIQSKRKIHFTLSLLFFLASLLSKAMAASLPVVLLLTDYLKGRKLTIKTISEKIPFFLLSIVLGIIAVYAQKSMGGIEDIEEYTFLQRIVFASYGFLTYLLKLLLPINLSAYYPYPIKSGDVLPAQYYIYLLLFSGLVIFVFYSLRFSKKILFGIGFFAVTVFLVLQLLPVGGAVMADRYSYIPSIGIFYLIGEAFYLLWNKNYKLPVVILSVVFLIFFSVKTYARCGVWKNGMTLWTDVINQYQTIPTAYNNRGIHQVNENRNREALSDFNKAIELKPDYANAYINRGNLLTNEKRNEQALKDYNKAIELEPYEAESYHNRGNLLQNIKKFDEALNDYNKAIDLRPGYVQAYYSRGLLLMNEKRNVLAYNDFSKAIKLHPSYIEAYINRGVLLQNENRLDEALMDYNKAVLLNPDEHKAYFNRGNLMALKKKYDEAINDFSLAIKLKNDYALAYFGRGVAECNSGKKDAGCADLQYSIGLGFQPAINVFNNLCR